MKNFTGTPSFFPLVQGKNLQEPLHFPKGKTRTFHPNPSGRSEDWEKSFKGALKGCWHGGVPHKFWMVYVMENPMIRWKSDDSSGMGDWGGPPFFVKPPDDWTCFHIHLHPFTSQLWTRWNTHGPPSCITMKNYRLAWDLARLSEKDMVDFLAARFNFGSSVLWWPVVVNIFCFPPADYS